MESGMKKIIISLVVFLIFVFSIPVPAALSNGGAEKWDLLFINGRVLDGTGNPCFHADVAVKDGKIAAVGRLQGKGSISTAMPTIASGMRNLGGEKKRRDFAPLTS
jgi:hypothetical protein